MCLSDGALRAYLDGEGADLDAAAQHLELCATCRARLEGAAARRTTVADLLTSLAPAESTDSPALALARLRDRARTSAPALLLQPRRLVATCAVAVVAGVAGLIIGSLGRSDGRQHAPTAPETQRADVDRAAVLAPTQAGPHERAPSDARSQPRAKRRAAPRPRRVAETEFLLTYGNRLPEMGIVLRLKLPAGLITGQEGDLGEQGSLVVDADVLVGQDGRAYAIRLLKDTETDGRK